VRGELASEVITDIVCSDYHNGAISAAGELWVWGCAVYGKLGFMPTESCVGFAEGTPYEPSPTRVGGALRGRRVVQALCSSVHTAAVTADGALFTWGSTLYGSLGYPPTAAMPVDANNFPYQPKPVMVSLPGVRVLRLVSHVYEPSTDDSLCPCSTKSCSIAITTGGLYTFGLADDGGLGYPPRPEMPTTVIGGYSRKCQWRPRLVDSSWSLLGAAAAGRHEPMQWSEAELAQMMRQVAVTPTSTHVIASPVAA
jgi:alpha-tubulin suppressor-like RCC1 family protein